MWQRYMDLHWRQQWVIACNSWSVLLLLVNLRKVPRVKSEEESRKSRRVLNSGSRTPQSAMYDVHRSYFSHWICLYFYRLQESIYHRRTRLVTQLFTYLLTHNLFSFSIQRYLVSSACDWVMPALSAMLLTFSFQFSLLFFNIWLTRPHQSHIYGYG